jgi:hypothetical protein
MRGLSISDKRINSLKHTRGDRSPNRLGLGFEVQPQIYHRDPSQDPPFKPSEIGRSLHRSGATLPTASSR